MTPVPGKPVPPKPRILVVDDEPAVRTFLLRYLTLTGYEVLQAGSGEEGLRIVFNGVPDLILLDISLPGMDGLEILRSLHEKYAHVRVIMLANTADMPKANLALACGASDYLAKPVDLPSLKRLLQVHLGSR